MTVKLNLRVRYVQVIGDDHITVAPVRRREMDAHLHYSLHFEVTMHTQTSCARLNHTGS